MGSQNLTIEEKVDRLYEHIESLSRRVAELEGRPAASTPRRSAAASTVRPETIVSPSLPTRPGKPPEKTFRRRARQPLRRGDPLGEPGVALSPPGHPLLPDGGRTDPADHHRQRHRQPSPRHGTRHGLRRGPHGGRMVPVSAGAAPWPRCSSPAGRSSCRASWSRPTPASSRSPSSRRTGR